MQRGEQEEASARGSANWRCDRQDGVAADAFFQEGLAGLCAFARAEFELSLPPPGSKNKTPLRKHLEKVWKSSGRQPAQLANKPQLPPDFAHLWQYFLELNTPEGLSFAEIEAWSKLTRRNVSAFEADVLRKLDRIYKEVIYGCQRAGN